MNGTRNSGRKRANSVPRYELIDKDGNVYTGRQFSSAASAAMHAAVIWPGQEQDEDRTGKGWDVQTVGCDR